MALSAALAFAQILGQRVALFANIIALFLWHQPHLPPLHTLACTSVKIKKAALIQQFLRGGGMDTLAIGR